MIFYQYISNLFLNNFQVFIIHLIIELMCLQQIKSIMTKVLFQYFYFNLHNYTYKYLPGNYTLMIRNEKSIRIKKMLLIY